MVICYEFLQLKSSFGIFKAIMVLEGVDTSYAGNQYCCGEQQAFLRCNLSYLL